MNRILNTFAHSFLQCLTPVFGCRAFIASGGIILLVTGLAKLISAFGAARVLLTVDPIFGIQFRHLFLLVGGLEIVVSLVCFFSRSSQFRLASTLWIATGFMLYRVGLEWVGYHKPCHCMGTLTDALGIPPMIADQVMKWILAYLLIGGIIVSFLSCRFLKHMPGLDASSPRKSKEVIQ